MPRAGEPRVTIRLDPESFAAITAAATSANVSTGALIRECAERYAVTVAREVARGDLKMRRARAVEAAGGAVAPASSLLRSDTAEAVARERQRRINESIQRARSAPAKGRRS